MSCKSSNSPNFFPVSGYSWREPSVVWLECLQANRDAANNNNLQAWWAAKSYSCVFEMLLCAVNSASGGPSCSMAAWGLASLHHLGSVQCLAWDTYCHFYWLSETKIRDLITGLGDLTLLFLFPIFQTVFAWAVFTNSKFILPIYFSLNLFNPSVFYK